MKTAQDRGFRTTIEEEILGGKARVDVSLTRGKERIAFQSSIASTIDEEFVHVRNALAADLRPGSIDEHTEDALDQTIPSYRAILRHKTGTDGERAGSCSTMTTRVSIVPSCSPDGSLGGGSPTWWMDHCRVRARKTARR